MKYLILGGGPAGLITAYSLIKCGCDSFILIEAENEAGGLCRSAEVDGSPLDIGGGHFLDVKNQKVNKMLFELMPESEWNYFERDSRIQLGEYQIHHPIEANIWELPEALQQEYLDSISLAGCNTGEERPELFVDWIRWKLGNRIADDYMLPYNRKMFADQLNDLGIYWLEKLPNVSYEETLKSCRQHTAFGTQPGHAHFYYPKKYGYGEVWLRIAEVMKKHIEYGKKAVSINYKTKTVRCSDGSCYSADKIITTIPWRSLEKIEGPGDRLSEEISKLRSTSVEIEYCPESLDTKAQWIYIPAEDIRYHRILVRENFCHESRGYWTERRLNEPSSAANSFFNEYAYPLNTIGKPEAIKYILDCSKEYGVIGLGRWGEHSHFNSDVTADRAIKLAEKLTGTDLTLF